MLNKVVSSCVFSGIKAVLLGLSVTLFLHDGIEVLNGRRQFQFYPNEPQWLGVSIIYFVLGFIWRYAEIEVYALRLRGFADRAPTGTNTSYKSAMIASALFFMVPFVFYFVFVLGIQAAAVDKATFGFSMQAVISKNVLHYFFGNYLGDWPLNYWLIMLLAGVIGAVHGFIKRADQRSKYIPLVAIAGALKSAIALPASGAVGVLILELFLRPFQPAWAAELEQHFMSWGLWALMLIGGLYGFYAAAHPDKRDEAREKLFADPEPFMLRLARFSFTFDLFEELGRTAFLAVLYSGLIWFAWKIAMPSGGDGPSWFTPFAIIITLLFGADIVSRLGAVLPQFFPPTERRSRQPVMDDD